MVLYRKHSNVIMALKVIPFIRPDYGQFAMLNAEIAVEKVTTGIRVSGRLSYWHLNFQVGGYITNIDIYTTEDFTKTSIEVDKIVNTMIQENLYEYTVLYEDLRWMMGENLWFLRHTVSNVKCLEALFKVSYATKSTLRERVCICTLLFIWMPSIQLPTNLRPRAHLNQLKRWPQLALCSKIDITII